MKKLATVFGYLWRALDALRKTLHLIVLLLVFLVILAAMSPRIPLVPMHAALVIAPNGAIVEQLAGDPLERAIAEVSGQSRPETLLRDLVHAVETAKDDDRIKALVLDLQYMAGGGIVKLEELAVAIREFRATGKPVIALGESYDQSQYYLAANADEIYLDPQGMVLIEGYGHYRNFLKGAIEKLAVDVHVFRAGQFKSYTDQFSRSDMSAQEREATQAWLDTVWVQYQNAVTAARGLEVGDIEAYTTHFVQDARNNAGDLAMVALNRGLVTALKSRREVEEHLKTLVGEDQGEQTFQAVTHWEYLAATRAAARQTSHQGDRIGVVVAAGEILDGEHPPGTIGSDSAVRLLRRALDDDGIKAVVLRIDSPGGSMLASEVIRREIQALQAAGKPVIASMSSTAASGGYYIAMDADEIWASPATITGSIGVFSVFPTLERSLEKIGITTDGVGTTPLAGALRVDRSLKPEVGEILQLAVENAYSTFIAQVAQAREKSVAEVDEIAQGRVWAGKDAAGQGLVDKLGTYRDALNAAAQRAGLGDDYGIEYIEPPLGWRQALAQRTQAFAMRIIQALVPERTLLSSARQMMSPLEQELTRLVRFGSDPRRVYYYCMCQVE